MTQPSWQSQQASLDSVFWGSSDEVPREPMGTNGRNPSRLVANLLGRLQKGSVVWLYVPSKYQGPVNLRDWFDSMRLGLGFSTTVLSGCHLMGTKSPPPYQKEMLQIITIPFTLKFFLTFIVLSDYKNNTKKPNK